MLTEGLEWDQLSEHVSRLLNVVNGIDGDLAMVNVVPKVVVLDIDVFGMRLNLWDGGNLNCPTVVLEDPAMDGWFGASKSEA